MKSKSQTEQWSGLVVMIQEYQINRQWWWWEWRRWQCWWRSWCWRQDWREEELRRWRQHTITPCTASSCTVLHLFYTRLHLQLHLCTPPTYNRHMHCLLQCVSFKICFTCTALLVHILHCVPLAWWRTYNHQLHCVSISLCIICTVFDLKVFCTCSYVFARGSQPTMGTCSALLFPFILLL